MNNLGQRHGLMHRGYGSFSVRNSKFSIYSDIGDSMYPIGRFDGFPCDLNITKRFQVLYENLYITNLEYQTKTITTAPTQFYILGDALTLCNITFSNVTMENTYGSGSTNPFLIQIPNNYGLTLKDITFTNVQTQLDMIRIEGGEENYLENVRFINCSVYGVPTVVILESNIVIISGISFQYHTISDAFSGNVFEIVSGILNINIYSNQIPMGQ